MICLPCVHVPVIIPSSNHSKTAAKNEFNRNGDAVRCCLFPCMWSSPSDSDSASASDPPVNTRTILDNDGEEVEESLEELSQCMKEALETLHDHRCNSNSHGDNSVLSKRFLSALLAQPAGYELRSVTGTGTGLKSNTQDKKESHDDKHQEYEHECLCFPDNDIVEQSHDGIILSLKGIPHRPYYKEISKRIHVLYRHYNKNASGTIANIDASMPPPRPLIDAELLGLKENDPTKQAKFVLPQNEISASNCNTWLQSLGEDGIRELLGMRNTVGTEPGCLPPDRQSLIRAACKPCTRNKPNAKPPHLTVAGKARAKHAHRGEDQFFGVCKGSTGDKNDAAEAIVEGLLADAVWINIHVFGGVQTPVVEVRNILGYGARWEADWSLKGCPEQPVDVVFRGFLEPQMDDGFERGWRH